MPKQTKQPKKVSSNRQVQEMVRRCKDCKWYKSRYGEFRINAEYIDKTVPGLCNSCFEYVAQSLFGIQACQHPNCFILGTEKDIVKGIIKTRKRIAGQAQLNSDNNCKYFKRKWWKFWVSV